MQNRKQELAQEASISKNMIGSLNIATNRTIL